MNDFVRFLNTNPKPPDDYSDGDSWRFLIWKYCWITTLLPKIAQVEATPRKGWGALRYNSTYTELMNAVWIGEEIGKIDRDPPQLSPLAESAFNMSTAQRNIAKTILSKMYDQAYEPKMLVLALEENWKNNSSNMVTATAHLTNMFLERNPTYVNTIDPIVKGWNLKSSDLFFPPRNPSSDLHPQIVSLNWMRIRNALKMFNLWKVPGSANLSENLFPSARRYEGL